MCCGLLQSEQCCSHLQIKHTPTQASTQGNFRVTGEAEEQKGSPSPWTLSCRRPSKHRRNPKWEFLVFCSQTRPSRPLWLSHGCQGLLPWARCTHLHTLSFPASTCRHHTLQHLRGHIQKGACLGNQHHISLLLCFSSASLEIR